MRLRVTEEGLALMREGERVFDEMRDALAETVGAEALATTEDVLRRLVGDRAIDLGAPGPAARPGDLD
jgi:hypothetical protein